MKITKTSSEAFEERKRRENANKGCNKCPCCGEPFVGITYKNLKVKGVFSVKMYYTDRYSCSKCGAEWESEPY